MRFTLKDEQGTKNTVSTNQDMINSVSLFPPKLHHFLPISFIVWLLFQTKQFEYFSGYEVLWKEMNEAQISRFLKCSAYSQLRHSGIDIKYLMYLILYVTYNVLSPGKLKSIPKFKESQILKSFTFFFFLHNT